MAVFNSLGSNYNLNFVIKSLSLKNKGDDIPKLKKLLEEKYGGKVFLTYKGREALTLALKILKLPKDSYIAINGFTCVAVPRAIKFANLKPICLDLPDRSLLNFSSQTLIESLKKNKKIRAVVIQNTLGFPCNIEAIQDVCRKNNLALIEDLAHCVGARYLNGKEAGTTGDITVLSFSQDKIIDAVSGGALVLRNKKYQDTELSNGEAPKNQIKDRFYPLLTYKIRFLYNFGLGKTAHFVLKKLNLLSNIMDLSFYKYYSLPSWYCSLALNMFRNLSNQFEHRRKISEIYAKNLDKKILSDEIIKLIPLSSNLRFPIYLENRNGLIQYLKKSNIFIGDIWYYDVAPECKIGVDVSQKILNLPTHINVSKNQAERICIIINQWLKSQ